MVLLKTLMEKQVRKRMKDPGKKCNLLTKKAKERERKERKKRAKLREANSRGKVTMDNCTEEEWDKAMENGVEFCESETDPDNYTEHLDNE